MALFGKKTAQKKEQALREREWGFEEFERFFQHEGKKSGNSSLFKDVLGAFEQLKSLREKEINLESAKEMVLVNQKLVDACKAYSQARGGAGSASGRERLAVIDSLCSYQNDINIDQMRDVRKLKEFQGMRWKQARMLYSPEIDLADITDEKVGSAVNQRFKVNYRGKTGFFTEERQLHSTQYHLQSVADRIDGNRNPALKEVISNGSARLKEYMDAVADSRDPVSQYSGIVDVIAEEWYQMEERNPKKGDFAKLVSSNENLQNVTMAVHMYQNKLKEDPAAQKEALMTECIKQNCKGEAGKICSENMDLLMNLPAIEQNDKVREDRRAKRTLIQIRAGLTDGEQIQALDDAIRNGTLVQELTDATVMAQGEFSAADNINTIEKLDQGIELTSRNVATSRIAELLGVGHMVAHSEMMKVRVNGEEKSGCFMEFAKGLDIDSRSEKNMALIEQLEFTHNASFLKDMCNMEALDFLCGQVDRHGANMFYQLSEPDASGKRTIVGLQGIDNDLAFGDMEKLRTRNQGATEKSMTFIGRELAENIAKLDKPTLEFALGDLIPQDQIERMAKRVEKFQKHMKESMVLVEPEGWKQVEKLVGQMESGGKISKDMVELGADAPGKSPLTDEQADRKKQNYVNGIESIFGASNNKVNAEHKDSVIKLAVQTAKEEVAQIRKEKAKQFQRAAVSFDKLQKQEMEASAGKKPRIVIGKRPERQAAKGLEDPGKKQQGMVK